MPGSSLSKIRPVGYGIIDTTPEPQGQSACWLETLTRYPSYRFPQDGYTDCASPGTSSCQATIILCLRDRTLTRSPAFQQPAKLACRSKYPRNRRLSGDQAPLNHHPQHGSNARLLTLGRYAPNTISNIFAAPVHVRVAPKICGWS